MSVHPFACSTYRPLATICVPWGRVVSETEGLQLFGPVTTGGVPPPIYMPAVGQQSGCIEMPASPVAWTRCSAWRCLMSRGSISPGLAARFGRQTSPDPPLHKEWKC